MMHTKPKIIGITGGVGSGKSEVLSYIEGHYCAKVMLSDLVAKQMQSPGSKIFNRLIDLLGEEVLTPEGEIDKGKMAAAIFADSVLLQKVNELIHPAVKQAIIERIEQEKAAGVYDFFFVEAALLIESGFDKICDELWYVFTREEVRRQRLKASRGYSDEKIDAIMAKQLSEDTFRKYCKVVLDNSGDLKETCKQIDQILEAYLWQE